MRSSERLCQKFGPVGSSSSIFCSVCLCCSLFESWSGCEFQVRSRELMPEIASAGVRHLIVW